MTTRLSLAIALLFALTGCELVADFDRSKIPTPEPDAGMPVDGGDGDEDAGDDTESDAGDEDDAG